MLLTSAGVYFQPDLAWQRVGAMLAAASGPLRETNALNLKSEKRFAKERCCESLQNTNEFQLRFI